MMDNANHTYRPTIGLLPTVKQTYSKLGLAVLFLSVATIVMQIVMSYLLVWAMPDAIYAWWVNWILSFVPLYGIGLPIFYLLICRLPIAPHNRYYVTGGVVSQKPRFPVTTWLLLLVLGFGGVYVGNIIGNMLMSMFSAVVGIDYSNAVDSMVSESPILVTAIATCVLAPIGEEFIFRKLLIDRARRYGDTTAILFSGLLFGLFHGNLFQFFYAAMLGILLAYIYTRTDNIWWCVGMHAVINFVGGVAVPALSQYVPAELGKDVTITQMLVLLGLMVWSYGCIAAAIVIFIKRLRRRVLAPATDLTPTRRVFRQAIGNPGMITAISVLAFWVLETLITPVFEQYFSQL